MATAHAPIAHARARFPFRPRQRQRKRTRNSNANSNQCSHENPPSDDSYRGHWCEATAIIEQPKRHRGSFREYSDDVVHRIRFIKRAQELGFSLSEIEELLSLQAKRGSCATIKQKAEAKLVQIEEKISDLQRIQSALLKMKSTCDSRKASETCPVLEEFYA